MTGPELKAIRRGLGLSAQGFADLLGISDGSTIRKWERDAVAINGQVERLATLLRDHREVVKWLGERP